MRPFSPFFRLLRKLRSRRSLRFTRAGALLVALTLGVGLGALNTGNNLIYIVFGGLLGLITASGVLSERALRGLELDWIAPAELFAGREAVLRFVLRNAKPGFPSLGIDLAVDFEGRAGRQTVRGRVFAVPAAGAASVDALFTPPGRGRYAAERAMLSTTFPFGLFRKTARLDGLGEVLAFPLPLEPGTAGRPPGGSERLRPLPRRGEGDSFWGVRDFQTGDSPRRISWKASARAGKLIVRETERESAEQVLLDMGERAEWGSLPPEELESAISFAAGLASQLHTGGYSVGCRSWAWAVPPSAGREVMARIFGRLALFDPSEPPADQAPTGDETAVDVLRSWREWKN